MVFIQALDVVTNVAVTSTVAVTLYNWARGYEIHFVRKD